MRHFTRFGITLGLALQFMASGAAFADLPAEFTDRPPAQLARATFDAEYGSLLVAEFGRILRENADPACLRSKGIAPDALEDLGRDLLVRNGTRMLEIHSTLIDAKKYEAVFAARAGKSGKTDLARLRQDPDVRRLLELGEPAKLATLAEGITEMVDRHAFLDGIRLTKSISPVAAGDLALMMANPSEKALEDQERFLKGRQSPNLKRWLELEDAMTKALLQSQDLNEYVRLGPRRMTPDAVRGLAGLCIFPGPKKPAQPLPGARAK